MNEYSTDTHSSECRRRPMVVCRAIGTAEVRDDTTGIRRLESMESTFVGDRTRSTDRLTDRSLLASGR